MLRTSGAHELAEAIDVEAVRAAAIQLQDYAAELKTAPEETASTE
jgi:hypothetical protein